MKKFALLLSFIYLLVFTLHTFVLADNPASPFTPSQNIQDPGDPSTPGTGGSGCGPNDSNCYVTVSTEISGLDPAIETNTIDNENFAQEWQWNTLVGGSGLKLSSTSTGVETSAIKLFEVNLSGENTVGDSSSSYAGYFSNTQTGDDMAAFGLYAMGTSGGIFAETTFGTAISAEATTGDGTASVSNSGRGVYAASISGKGLYAYSASDTGVYASTGTGVAIEADAFTSSNPAILSRVSSVVTDSVLPVFRVSRNTGALGGGTSGIGSSIELGAETSTTENTISNTIISKWTNATHATRTSEFSITGVNNATTSTLFTISGNGNTGIGDTTPLSLLTVGDGDLFQIASDGSIDAVTGYIQGSGTMSLTSANTTQSTISSIFALNANSLTTGTGMYLASSTLTSGSLIDLAVTGTGAIDTQKGINVSLTGANATGSQTSYGVYVSNAHSGTNPHNYALYGTVANGSTVSAGVWGNNSGTGYGVSGISTSGSGVNASSTSGTGISAATTTGTYAGSFQVNPASTNTAASVLGINRFSSGTPAAGIGASILFNIENDGGAAFQANSLESSWTDVTHATRTSEFSITGYNSGTLGTLMTLEGNGEVGIGTTDPATLLHLSASTANTGSAQSVLTVNAYSTGTPALGFGPGIVFTGESNGGPNDRDMVALNAVWEQSSVDASRTSALVFQNVSSAGALTERFRFTPSAMTTATSYTLGNSNSTITLGGSSYQVAVTSSGVNVGAAAIFGPSNTSEMSFGKTLSTSSGSSTYTAINIANGFNLTGSASGVMRGLYVNPGFTSLVSSYRAVDIAANHANAYGIYQSGTSTQNYFAGEVGIANSSPGVALHVGSSSTTDATTLLRLEDANSTCNFTADAGAPTCGSDERLKKDIEELSTEEILAGITALNPVSYRWKTDSENAELQYGFLAQNVQAQFPNLVKEGTWIDGSQKLFLSMGGLMPYAVGAIKELNIKLTAIENFEEENNSFGQKLRAWLSNSTNKITRIFTGEICLTDPGEEAVCLNRSELKNLKALLSESSSQNSNNESNNDSSGGESAPVVENEPQEVVEEVVVPEDPETVVEDTETEAEGDVETPLPDSSTQEETVTESEPEVPAEEESPEEEEVSQVSETTEAESTTE